MAASYFGKKAPYGFVMEVTLLYVFILWSGWAASFVIQLINLALSCK
jgi:hypothetical protein